MTWFVKIPGSVLKIECTSKHVAGTISFHVAGDLLTLHVPTKKVAKVVRVIVFDACVQSGHLDL